MNIHDSNLSTDDTKVSEINLQEKIQDYTRHWVWFLLSVLVFLIGAYIYIRYSTPIYTASTKILVKDDKKGGIMSELELFSDLEGLKLIKSNVDNEIEVIKSRTLSEMAVKTLGLNISYFGKGLIKTAELYENPPVRVVFEGMPETFYEKPLNFFITVDSKTKFTLYDGGEKKIGVYNFDTPFEYHNGKCLFRLEDAKKVGANIQVLVNTVSNTAASFSGRLNVNVLGKNTSVIELSITDPTPEKAEDYLDAIVKMYIQDGIDDKNYVSKNTSNFIEDRLRKIVSELEGVEKDAESYKRTNRITDVASESGLFLQNATEFEKREIEIETQLKIVETLVDYVKKNSNADLVPANVVTSDVNASGLIDQYNQMVLNRNRLLKNAGAENPVVRSLDEKIATLKENIKETLSRLKSSLIIKRNDLRKQNALLTGKIATIPTLEKEIRSIGRQQQIKESLYLYLLEKREEIAISLAVTAPNAKIIDTALASKSPISPKKNVIYLVAMSLGLLIPFAVIYLRDLLDTKVKGRQDVEGKLKIPFIGEIPTSFSNEEIINKDSRSAPAEAIRIVRTNLEFMLNQVPEGQAKTIFITSTLPKEGKTFIAANLAGTIALSGKKVLLIGMDIRNPKLDSYLNLNVKGVTNYLASKDLDIQDLISKQEGYDDFYVLPSGVIPPNPAELLMNPKVNTLFETLKKQYDYIVVDTAPVTMVADTVLIAKHADSFVYVVRANYLDKSLLQVPEQLYRENKLPNMSILINDTSIKKGYGYGYGGYGYGYGVEVEKKSLLQRILDKFKKEA